VKETSLDDLWNSAKAPDARFDPASLAGLPEPVLRYLQHAIAPGTPLASAVRLRMHGEIKLKRWYAFSAEQVICWSRGFIWQAAVRMGALTIRSSDRYVDGSGAMRWKLFGLAPLVTASGPDITRSAAGRVNLECAWVPSVLCGEDVCWSASDALRIRASFKAHGEMADVTFGIDATGAAKTLSAPRWGNPEAAAFHYATFGGFADNEATFGGYTVPTSFRAGWYFGSDRFEPEGEFFRAAIDSAEYKQAGGGTAV
jgi:hypothetical protein